jgi:hypothetical protein
MTFLKPAFEWVGSFIESKLSIAVWVFDAMADGVSEVAGFVRGLGNDMEQSLGIKIPTIKEIVIGNFRLMGTAVAYVWDGIKAGAGGVAVVLGMLIEKFGEMTVKYKDTAKAIIDASADMAEAVGLDETATKLRALGNNMENVGEKIKGAGQDMQKWGKKQIDNFGKSAEQFNKWLDDKLKPKPDDKKPPGAGAGGDGLAAAPAIAKWAGAITQGSKEAYSLNLKNMYGDRGQGEDPQTKQLKKNGQKQDEGNKALAGIQKQLAGIGTF